MRFCPEPVQAGLDAGVGCISLDELHTHDVCSQASLAVVTYVVIACNLHACVTQALSEAAEATSQK